MRITPQQHNTALAAAQADLELQRELADSSGIGLWFEEAAGIDGLRIDGVINLPALVDAILKATQPESGPVTEHELRATLLVRNAAAVYLRDVSHRTGERSGDPAAILDEIWDELQKWDPAIVTEHDDQLRTDTLNQVLAMAQETSTKYRRLQDATARSIGPASGFHARTAMGAEIVEHQVRDLLLADTNLEPTP